MKLFEGCLLACDLDGTLLSDEGMAERNAEKIKYFIEEGGHFSMATGRTPSAVGEVLRKIPDVSPSVMANGGVIYDFQNKKTLFSVCIPKEDRFVLRDILEKFDGVAAEVHIGEKVYIFSDNSESRDHREYEEFGVCECAYDEMCAVDFEKIIFFAPDNDTYNSLWKYAEGLEVSSRFIKTSATIKGSKRNYIEFVPKGVSKALTVGKLVEILGIKAGNCFAMGDYYNDVEMLRFADICAVPEETPDDIKEIATIVVGNVKNGAVADFIDYLSQIKTAALKGSI